MKDYNEYLADIPAYDIAEYGGMAAGMKAAVKFGTDNGLTEQEIFEQLAKAYTAAAALAVLRFTD